MGMDLGTFVSPQRAGPAQCAALASLPAHSRRIQRERICLWHSASLLLWTGSSWETGCSQGSCSWPLNDI